MTAEIALDSGTCLAFGGTNARTAVCHSGELLSFSSVETPTHPEEFFKWMARSLLAASHESDSWLVAGFPGPVSLDGKRVGPLVNVAGMRAEEYDLASQLTAADPEVGRVIEQGFTLLAVNDGALAAQAAASRTGNHHYNATGALIFGTGVGAGVVRKDPHYSDVHRVDHSPLEVGHLLVRQDSLETFEQRYAGPALEQRFNMSPTSLDPEHPVWIEEGKAVGRLSLVLGIMSGVELVVPTGGLGIGASAKYAPHLKAFLEDYKVQANAAQTKFTPNIVLVPPDEAEKFEMYGAEGVMRDHLAA